MSRALYIKGGSHSSIGSALNSREQASRAFNASSSLVVVLAELEPALDRVEGSGGVSCGRLQDLDEGNGGVKVRGLGTLFIKFLLGFFKF